MLAALRHRLTKVLTLIVGKEKALKVAQRRWQMNHVKAVANHRAGQKSKQRAKRFLTYGDAENVKKGEAEFRRAKRQSGRALRAHDRATWWVDRAKELTQALHNLTTDKGAIESEIRKLGVQVDFEGNKVSGGTPKQRVGVAMHVSAARAREYYSQSGTYSANFCLTGPPDMSYRYDCSSWFASVYKCAGLEDPNGLSYTAGWTGTLGEHGHAISEGQLDTGDAVLFGYAPFHHVEMKDGPMSKGPWTIGHGSSAVDQGTVNLLPGPRSFRRYL